MHHISSLLIVILARFLLYLLILQQLQFSLVLLPLAFFRPFRFFNTKAKQNDLCPHYLIQLHVTFRIYNKYKTLFLLLPSHWKVCGYGTPVKNTFVDQSQTLVTNQSTLTNFMNHPLRIISKKTSTFSFFCFLYIRP